jgi:hypothetical protein
MGWDAFAQIFFYYEVTASPMDLRQFFKSFSRSEMCQVYEYLSDSENGKGIDLDELCSLSLEEENEEEKEKSDDESEEEKSDKDPLEIKTYYVGYEMNFSSYKSSEPVYGTPPFEQLIELGKVLPGKPDIGQVKFYATVGTH